MFPKQICQTYGHQTSTTLGCERQGIGCERQGILITGNKLFDVTFGSFAEFCRANFWQHSLAIVSQALPKTQLGWFEQESWFLVKSNNDPSTSNLFWREQLFFWAAPQQQQEYSDDMLGSFGTCPQQEKQQQ